MIRFKDIFGNEHWMRERAIFHIMTLGGNKAAIQIWNGNMYELPFDEANRVAKLIAADDRDPSDNWKSGYLEDEEWDDDGN